jgi:hypothetical protein
MIEIPVYCFGLLCLAAALVWMAHKAAQDEDDYGHRGSYEEHYEESLKG